MLRNFRSALGDANKMIKLKPREMKGYYRKGEVMSALNKHYDANAEYSKCYDLEPDNLDLAEKVRIQHSQLMNSLGMNYMDRETFDEFTKNDSSYNT